MKRVWKDVFVIGILFFSSFLFFFHVFYPEPGILITPDFGRSDAWHSSFAAKSILSETLKKGTIPLWEPRLGGGYPLFADGLIGTFFIPNLVLFRFLPTVPAYNLLLVLLVGLTASGVYVWLRLLRMNHVAAGIAGITFGFSGVVMGQLTHLMLLPALSLLPWVCAATTGLSRSSSRFWVCLLAFITSQQILAGFPQVTFITLLFCTGFILATARNDWKTLSRFVLGIILGIMMSAVQLLPSYEFLTNSTAEGGFNPLLASYYSFPVKHLLTFIRPFIFGNPKLGTYPHFLDSDGSIFWENIGYFGIIPLLFSAAGIILTFKKGTTINRFMLLTLIVSILLMTGKHSPLYFIFSFWPFHLFRVPSRFISLFVLSLVYFAGYSVSQLRLFRVPLFRISLIILFIVNTVFLMNFWRSYHSWAGADEWTAEPEVLSRFSIPQADRVFTLGAERIHNAEFAKTGWADTKPYWFLRNTLSPNSGVLWNRSTTGVYAGRTLRRPALIESLVTGGMQISGTEATISAKSQKYLNLVSGTTVITTSPVHRPELIQQGEVTYNDYTLYIYTNTRSVPRVYLSTTSFTATTVEEALRIMNSGNFIPGKSVLMETDTGINIEKVGQGSATLLSHTGREALIHVNNPSQKAVLVFSDTFYPGWEATIDGSATRVFAANIRDKAIIVGEGEHSIRFFYNPNSFRLGVFISLQGIAFTILVMAFPVLFSFPGTVATKNQPGKYHRRNHDT